MPQVKRHIAKTISYRILGTMTTILLTVYAGLPLKWAGIVGIGELLLKPLLYFLHERAWYRFSKYGITIRNTKIKETNTTPPNE
jgi:uncharacterized membrane protein